MSNKLGQRKQRKQLMTHLTGDPTDSWAAVELFRWQYGKLPSTTDMRPLDVPVALRAMAAALLRVSPSEWPTPQNLSSVLFYVAKQLTEQQKQAAKKHSDWT